MGSGFIVGGQLEQPGNGLDCENWRDNPRLRLTREDHRTRADDAWIHVVVIHTTKGLPANEHDPPQIILDGFGTPVGAGERVARYWSGDGRNAGAHLIIDHDGEISQTCDLQTEVAYHAEAWNGCSIGIELYQGGDGTLYRGQLQRCVLLLDYLTRRFGIQRQFPHRYTKAVPRFLDREDKGRDEYNRKVLGDVNGYRDVVGIIGHRDCSNKRGPGDPGSAIFREMGLAGYTDLDYTITEDRDFWRRIQRKLNVDRATKGRPEITADGVAGPATVQALRETGNYPEGLWVKRPGDAP
jgi:hypothetical protein